MRAGEAFSLKWAHIDMEHRLINPKRPEKERLRSLVTQGFETSIFTNSDTEGYDGLSSNQRRRTYSAATWT